jgi:hypothetical protein
VYEILYVVVTTTTKVSVLLLYHRIFPQPWLQKTVWWGCGFMAIHFFLFFFVVVFQCKPVTLVFDKMLEGTCIDFYPVILSGAIVTILEDVVIISLPIPSLLKLNLKLRKKISVILIMSVGMMYVLPSLPDANGLIFIAP